MPTLAASTTTSAVKPSSSSGPFIRQVMPGQEGVPVGPIPIHRDRTPRRRWCAFSWSIPGAGKAHQPGGPQTINVTIDKTGLKVGKYQTDLILTFTFHDPAKKASHEPTSVLVPV